ncbi:A24 family peptidase [Nocardioidaceae bacterium]|nr:A24 family peptidase [Nocardioidaceae bacterium]
MSSDVLLVLVAALVAAGLSAMVPTVVARLPEPAPEPEVEEREGVGDPLAPPTPKIPYAVLARARGLRAWCVLAGAAAGAACGFAVEELGRPGLLPALLMMVPLGVALAYIDARTRLLPSALIKPAYPALVALLLLGAVVDGSWTVLRGAALGWLVLGGLYLVLNLVYPAGMGYGDVRLAGLLGMVLGYAGLAPLLVGLEAAFLLGAVGGLVPVVWRRVRGLPRVRGYPFGPYMLLGALVGLVVGEPLLRALLGGPSAG